MITTMFGFGACAIAVDIGGTDSAAASAKAPGHGFDRMALSCLSIEGDRDNIRVFLRCWQTALETHFPRVHFGADEAALTDRFCTFYVRRHPEPKWLRNSMRGDKLPLNRIGAYAVSASGPPELPVTSDLVDDSPFDASLPYRN
jgi:hypothetical protein